MHRRSRVGYPIPTFPAMTPEELFNSTRLDVIVSEEVLDLPDVPDIDDWLSFLTRSKQRETAFFGECYVRRAFIM